MPPILTTSKISNANPDFEEDYNNRVQLLCLLADTNKLVGEWARGTGKTTNTFAPRMERVANDMPQASFVVAGPTYVSLLKNVVPSVVEYYSQYYEEGKYFVVGKEPPKHFKKPFRPVYDYKYCLSTVHGNAFQFVSVMNPEAVAGQSVPHIFADELKHINPQKFKSRFFPILRGNKRRFGKSPYFMGFTGFSDTPKIDLGEYDWFFDYEQEMDSIAIKFIQNIALIVNKLKLDIIAGKNVVKAQKQLDYYEGELRVLRKKAVYYSRASAIANIEILGMQYLQDQLIALGWEEFKTSILNIRSRSVEKSFFVTFSAKNIYDDSYLYHRIDNLGIADKLTITATDLKYYDKDLPLEIGVDFGGMNSIVVAQTQGKTMRILKNFYTLTPQYLEELAHKLKAFFPEHRNRTIQMYYDRAGNNYGINGQAAELRKHLEEGTQGFKVNPMSLGIATVAHGEYYNLFGRLFAENEPTAPRIQIDRNECKELVSSIYLSEMYKDYKGRIQLNKKSEKLNLEKLPMYSTNMATALWYLVYQKYSKFRPTLYTPNFSSSLRNL